MVENSTFSFDTLSTSINFIWNGIQISECGDYSVTLINSNGCDSIAFLNVTFNDISSIIYKNNKERTLIGITDLLGRETNKKKSKILLYIYDDGIVEKKLILE